MLDRRALRRRFLDLRESNHRNQKRITNDYCLRPRDIRGFTGILVFSRPVIFEEGGCLGRQMRKHSETGGNTCRVLARRLDLPLQGLICFWSGVPCAGEPFLFHRGVLLCCDNLPGRQPDSCPRLAFCFLSHWRDYPNRPVHARRCGSGGSSIRLALRPRRLGHRSRNLYRHCLSPYYLVLGGGRVFDLSNHAAGLPGCDQRAREPAPRGAGRRTGADCLANHTGGGIAWLMLSNNRARYSSVIEILHGNTENGPIGRANESISKLCSISCTEAAAFWSWGQAVRICWLWW